MIAQTMQRNLKPVFEHVKKVMLPCYFAVLSSYLVWLCFRPDIEECVLMGLTEMFFYHRLRKRQGERLAKADSDLQQ